MDAPPFCPSEKIFRVTKSCGQTSYGELQKKLKKSVDILQRVEYFGHVKRNKRSQQKNDMTLEQKHSLETQIHRLSVEVWAFVKPPTGKNDPKEFRNAQMLDRLIKALIEAKNAANELELN